MKRASPDHAVPVVFVWFSIAAAAVYAVLHWSMWSRAWQEWAQLLQALLLGT